MVADGPHLFSISAIQQTVLPEYSPSAAKSSSRTMPRRGSTSQFQPFLRGSSRQTFTKNGVRKEGCQTYGRLETFSWPLHVRLVGSHGNTSNHLQLIFLWREKCTPRPLFCLLSVRRRRTVLQ